MSTINISEHFTNVASDYHVDKIFQSPDSAYGRWLSDLLFKTLQLKPGHTLADAGCGTGIDCLWLLKKMDNEISIVASDPAQGMIETLNNEIEKFNLSTKVKTFCLDAMSFGLSNDVPSYNRLLLKYFIHLVPREERLKAFQGFYHQLDPEDNKLVIIARAAKETYPFDERTQQMFLAACIPIEVYAEELRSCGFVNIEHENHLFVFDSSITLDDWITMIEKRLWSTFSKEKMNDEEQAQLISYLRSTYSTQPFQLRDEICVLTCSKPKLSH